MKIHVELNVVQQTKWYEYALRFLFGGLITATAGIIAKKFGPEIGGLFLAFPAIFPASATLIEKHEKEKKARRQLNGTTESFPPARPHGGLFGVGDIVYAALASSQTIRTL